MGKVTRSVILNEAKDLKLKAGFLTYVRNDRKSEKDQRDDGF